MVEFDSLGRPIPASSDTEVKDTVQDPSAENTSSDTEEVADAVSSDDTAESSASTVGDESPTTPETSSNESPAVPAATAEESSQEEPLSSEQDANKYDYTLDSDEVSAEDPSGPNAGKIAAKIVETAFGRGPIQRGFVRGVEDIYNFASWAGDLLERTTGIEQLLDEAGITEDGFFSNDPDFGRGAISNHMYESTGTVGKMAEEGTRFMTGFVGANPIAQAGRGAITLGAKKLAKPAFVGLTKNNKSKRAVVDKVRGILENPAVKKFNEGGVQGGIADFMLTSQEDELLTDIISMTKGPIQETFINSMVDEDPPSLMERKLRAVMEGYLLGGAANHVVDDLLTVFSRARQNGVLSVFTNTAEEQAAKVANPTKDPIVGKRYQGEIIVKVKDSKGKPVYAKESQVSEVSPGVRKLKSEDGFIAPADVGPHMGVDEFSPNIDEYVDAWVKKYDEAGKLSRAVKKIPIDDKLLSNRSMNVIERIKAIGTGSDEDIMNAIRQTDTYGIYRAFKKGPVNLKDLRQLAADNSINLDDYMAAFPNVSAEQIAAKFYRLDQAKRFFDEYLADNLEKARNLDTETLATVAQASDMVTSMLAEFDNLGTVAGQSLSVYGHHKKTLSASLNESIHKYRLAGVNLEAILKKAEAQVGLDENALNHLRSKDTEVLNDILYTNYVSNLLYGGATHVVNITSGLSKVIAKNMGRGYVAALSKDTASAAGSRAFLRQGLAMSTFGDAISESMRALRSGRVPDHLLTAGERQKAQEVYRVYDEVYRRWSHMPVLGALLKGASLTVRGPTNLLAAGDVFVKSLMYNQGIADGAARALTEAGQSPQAISEAIDKIGKKQFDYNVPGMNFNEIIDDLGRELSETTFTMKSNTMMQMVNRSLEKRMWGFQPLKFLVPFARVDMNIVRDTINTTPFIGAFTKDNKTIFQTGSIAAQERRLGDMMATSSFMVAGSTLYAAGLMTGSGPSDQREAAALRRTGWKPYSLSIPGYGYFDMRRLGSVGNALAMAVWGSEMLENMEEADGSMAEALAGTYVMFTETFTPQFISDTLPRALEAISQEEGEKKITALQNIIANIAPNAILPGTGVYSRNAALLGQGDINEFDFDESRIKAAFLRAFPHLDMSHRPQVDFLGNDRNRSPWSATKDMDLLEEYSRLTDSQNLSDEADQWESSLIWTPPRKHIEKTIMEERGRVYKLSHDKYYMYQKWAAGIYDEAPFDPGLPAFKDVWREEMKAGYPTAQSRYGSASDEAVTTWVRDLKRRYNAVAKDLLMSDDEVIQGTIEGTEGAIRLRNDLLQRGPIKVR